MGVVCSGGWCVVGMVITDGGEMLITGGVGGYHPYLQLSPKLNYDLVEHDRVQGFPRAFVATTLTHV